MVGWLNVVNAATTGFIILGENKMGTDIHGSFQAKKGGKWEDVASTFEYGRNYLLFGWLGNVRNGTGFAGVVTGTPLEPLSDCRDVPSGFLMDDDTHPVSSVEFMEKWAQTYYKEGEQPAVWMGDHSHSWVSDEEVLNAKPQNITHYGIITLDEYHNLEPHTQPTNGWCGGISGPDVVVTDKTKGENIHSGTTHVRVQWKRDVLADLEYFIEEMRRLHEEHVTVRFVFGFDS